MFRGITAINIDAKGRMAIPTRYRTCLSEESDNQMVITIDTEEPCLLLYPFSAWEGVERKIESLPSFNRASRRIQRLLIGHASEVELDANGRLLIPPLLREYAVIEKHVILVGQGKKFEVWSNDLWMKGRDTWLAETFDANAKMPDELQDVSL